MPLPKLTYEDFKSRISMQEVLQDAGYVLNRKDGLRHPSFVRAGSDGRRVKGDKFIISGGGNCCFRPPERKNYNIISFIKEFPILFSDYKPGMAPDRLVNLVCNRLLNQPIEERQSRIFDPVRDAPSFGLGNYEISKDFKHIARFLIPRKISKETQEAFADHIFVTTKQRDDGKKTYANLCFPLTKPNSVHIIGLEERGFPLKDGKSSYKGLAAGSDAKNGLWIANMTSKELSQIEKVYWFVSAFDAMSFWQLRHKSQDLNNAVFVSTSGSPSQEQFRGMIAATPQAEHHLCFDRDRTGQVFAINFALTKDRRTFTTALNEGGVLKVTDREGLHEFDMDKFDFRQIAEELKITDAVRYPKEFEDYMSTLFNPDDVFSGDADLLPGEVGKAYAAYETANEEYLSSKQSGLVCPEEVEEL